MIVFSATALFLAGMAPALPAADGSTSVAEAVSLLEAALSIAESIEETPLRSDAVGRVVAELARVDPRRALDLVEGRMATHQQSEAMARAAEGLARDNRFLGLATLVRIGDRSTVLTALGRIVGMEALADLDEAVKIVEKIDTLPVRRMVEREVARAVWAELAQDEREAVETAVSWADTITDPVTHQEALAYAAEGAAGHDLRKAEELIERIPEGDARDLAWRLVIGRVSARDPSSAAELLDHIKVPLQWNLAGVAALSGLVTAGQEQEALRLAAEIRSSVENDIEDPRDQGIILEQVALSVADLDAAYAVSVLTGVWPAARRYAAQCLVARSEANTRAEIQRELLEDGWVEVRRTDSPLMQEQIASAALAAAEDVAPEFIETMKRERPELVQRALPAAVRIVAVDGPDLALRLADRIEDAAALEMAKAEVAGLVARTQPDLARRIADELTTPQAKSAALVALASALMPQAVD